MNIFLAVICVLMFSFTAPLTRLASLAMPAESIILLRIIGAGLVCGVFVISDKWLPPKKAWPGIIATALGTVIGFNSLMAYGLREVPAGHAAVALAALPLATSIYSILRDRLNPGVKFWFFSLAGTLLSFGFFFILNVEKLLLGDLLLFLSVLSAAFGYVEGGRSGRIYGGARTMSWAVLITLPVCILLSLVHFNKAPLELSELGIGVGLSLLYLGFVSQSLGMFLWFKVLAIGPMEKIALVQLLQPFLTLLIAIIVLGENVRPLTWLIASLVALCVIGSNREKQMIR